MKNMQERITDGLKDGTIKMGNVIPFLQNITFDDDPAPNYYQLTITRSYMEDVRKHYEDMI